MSIEELKRKIKENDIPKNWSYIYTDNEPFGPPLGTLFILDRNGQGWDFYSIDERGSRRGERVFSSAEDSYNYLWEKLEWQLNFSKKYLKVVK